MCITTNFQCALDFLTLMLRRRESSVKILDHLHVYFYPDDTEIMSLSGFLRFGNLLVM